MMRLRKSMTKLVNGLLCLLLVLSINACSSDADSATDVLDDTQVTMSEGNESGEKDSETVTEEKTEAEEDSEKTETADDTPSELSDKSVLTAADVPAYTGKNYVIINDNSPNFDVENLAAVSYEYYSELDSLGRCGVVHACIGTDLMPTEERGSIGQVKPTGWQTVKYDIVDGKYLYNRCHLIGFQLSGENANTRNLITGTRQMNVDGMLPFENMVADYVKETDNHVMYRVTPVFEGDNLLAIGVQMEAYSVEDEGDGICFNVFVYNVQDGISINYRDGSCELVEEVMEEPTAETVETEEKETHSTGGKYAVNGRNGKIHIVGECAATGEGDNAMADPVYFDTYEEALEYSKKIDSNLEKTDCGNCF